MADSACCACIRLLLRAVFGICRFMPSSERRLRSFVGVLRRRNCWLVRRQFSTQLWGNGTRRHRIAIAVSGGTSKCHVAGAWFTDVRELHIDSSSTQQEFIYRSSIPAAPFRAMSSGCCSYRVSKMSFRLRRHVKSCEGIYAISAIHLSDSPALCPCALI